jgi:transposase
VVADIAKLSMGREEYYTRELATDHEAYLSGHGESPGRWYGAGATTLGPQGEASVAGFRAMFEGRDPTIGELLGRQHGRNAVPAFDVVLRPAKCVSVLYGLGDPVTGRAVLAAHHAGVREAVAYLDGHLGTRRGHDGVQHVSGRGLLAVGFDHRTSREGDPLLHTHLVVANRTQGPDGRWTALDGRDLYRHRLAADAIYRATYQHELSRSLGVEWTAADIYGNRELQGMPQDLVRSFSKRTGQIDAELDRLAADGQERTPRLVKWTVHATRKPKEHEAPGTLYDRWRAEAVERGHDPDTLVRAAARAVQGRQGSVPKTGDGQVEMIRSLRVARATAMKARTQAINALKALVVTAPEELREQLRGLSTVSLVRAAARFEPGAVTTPMAAAKLALRALAGRYQILSIELTALDVELARLTATVAPRLVALFGVGPDSAGALLVAAGDNPDRLRSDAAFSMLCGASPIEASSGKTRRHRLNRGGDRQANAALHRIVVTRLRHDRRTQDYLARRLSQGKSRKEAIRCLKRYLVREVYRALP